MTEAKIEASALSSHERSATDFQQWAEAKVQEGGATGVIFLIRGSQKTVAAVRVNHDGEAEVQKLASEIMTQAREMGGQIDSFSGVEKNKVPGRLLNTLTGFSSEERADLPRKKAFKVTFDVSFMPR